MYHSQCGGGASGLIVMTEAKGFLGMPLYAHDKFARSHCKQQMI